MRTKSIIILFIIDELVKSHIPYVVHASTKPVLSEPFILREPPFVNWG